MRNRRRNQIVRSVSTHDLARIAICTVITILRVGALQSEQGERCVLWADHLVGRAPEATLRLDESAVSWRHATLRWSHGTWELQDLGSLNGTFVNGVRIRAGARVMLRMGARLRFGDMPGEWAVIDLEPPQAVATSLDDGTCVNAQAGLIALPNAEAPEVSLYRRIDGVWIAESHERTWEPQRDEVIETHGRRYRFETDAAEPVRATVPPPHASAGALALEIGVTEDDEPLEIGIAYGPQRSVLEARPHHRLLLALARQRTRDVAEAVPSQLSGWVDEAALGRLLGQEPQQLAADVYRLRLQFAEAGVVDAAQIIERRGHGSSRELRIGIERISIVPVST